jgi:hypothetical protein
MAGVTHTGFERQLVVSGVVVLLFDFVGILVLLMNASVPL